MKTGYVNTDKEIWRKEENNYYSPSIHITKDRGVGINVGGIVFVKPIEEWHKLAQSNPSPEPIPNVGLMTPPKQTFTGHNNCEPDCPFCEPNGYDDFGNPIKYGVHNGSPKPKEDSNCHHNPNKTV